MKKEISPLENVIVQPFNSPKIVVKIYYRKWETKKILVNVEKQTGEDLQGKVTNVEYHLPKNEIVWPLNSLQNATKIIIKRGKYGTKLPLNVEKPCNCKLYDKSYQYKIEFHLIRDMIV